MVLSEEVDMEPSEDGEIVPDGGNSSELLGSTQEVLKIQCSDWEWMLDEDTTNRLCNKSEYFDRAFFGEHKAVYNGVVRLHQDPYIVDMVVDWLKTDTYDATKYSERLSEPEVHVRVYVMAQAYAIETFDDLAGMLFDRTNDGMWKSDGFAKAVLWVYNADEVVTKPLRDEIWGRTSNSLSDLFCDRDAQSRFRETIRQAPRDLMEDLLVSVGMRAANMPNW